MDVKIGPEQGTVHKSLKPWTVRRVLKTVGKILVSNEPVLHTNRRRIIIFLQK